MNTAYIYLQLYRLFDNATPVATDCGRLCNKACCSGDDAGMYLFPGEEEVYKLLSPDWAYIENSDFEYTYKDKTYKTPILFCNGSCDRYQRPLSCRIFPAVPHLDKDGHLEIIMDPRAKSLCPLAKGFYLEDLDANFIKKIKKSFMLLMKNKRFYAFMKEYSSHIDEFLRFFGK